MHTGDVSNAGTDANVFLNIFGSFGDTGERPLEKSATHKNKFERKNVDIFNIEACLLKNIHKIVIGHDNSGGGPGWFLKKVVVKQVGEPKYDQNFECNRWLATDEDDGAIVRELVVGQSQYLDKTSYHVLVKTGDKFGAGTDANVHLKMYGTNMESNLIRLETSENTKNKFERGQVDEFRIESEDIGKIERILIGHDGKNPGAGWFFDYAEISVPSKGIKYL